MFSNRDSAFLEIPIWIFQPSRKCILTRFGIETANANTYVLKMIRCQLWDELEQRLLSKDLQAHFSYARVLQNYINVLNCNKPELDLVNAVYSAGNPKPIFSYVNETNSIATDATCSIHHIFFYFAVYSSACTLGSQCIRNIFKLFVIRRQKEAKNCLFHDDAESIISNNNR